MSSLLATGLRVKVYPNDVATFWNVGHYHQTSLPAGGPVSHSPSS